VRKPGRRSLLSSGRSPGDPPFPFAASACPLLRTGSLRDSPLKPFSSSALRRPKFRYSLQDLLLAALHARSPQPFLARPVPTYFYYRLDLRQARQAPRRASCNKEGNRREAAAPSIFSADKFGRYVVTHFLAGADLHGHRPAVLTRRRLSWALSASLWRLTPPLGSSRFAVAAYQQWPTRSLQEMVCLRRSTHTPVAPFRSSRRDSCLLAPGRPSSALPHASVRLPLSCRTFRWEPATRRFDWSFAPMPRSPDRFARQNPSEPLPGFPPASLCPGIVHRLSGRMLCARSSRARVRTEARPSSRGVPGQPSPGLRLLRVRPSLPYTRAEHALLGPCFKTGPRAPSVAAPGLLPPVSLLFTPLPWCFSSFPRGTSPLSDSHSYLAFDGSLHPFTLRSHSELLPLSAAPLARTPSRLRAFHPLWAPSTGVRLSLPQRSFPLSSRALPLSLAATPGIFVNFFSSPY
jgi:hypothetical protein